MIRETDKLLSIIIPTYNMEKYIARCLESLLIPEIDKLDIIVVNDGSKDKSSEIAHGIQKKYPNSINVIDKDNGNYGSCINRGLKEAKGKYVKILDADDSFNTTDFSAYINQLSKLDADCIITDYRKEDLSGKILCNVKYNSITAHKNLTLEDILDVLVISISMHAITLKTSLLHEINYSQTEGISYTDMEWIFLPIAMSKSFTYLPFMVYKYYIGREGQTVSPEKCVNYFNDSVKGIERQTECIQNSKGLNNIQYEYLIKRLKKRILKNYYTVLSVNDQRRNLLNTLDLRYDKTWIDMGINLENETEIPIVHKSYVRDWRKLKHSTDYCIPIYYKVWNTLTQRLINK